MPRGLEGGPSHPTLLSVQCPPIGGRAVLAIFVPDHRHACAPGSSGPLQRIPIAVLGLRNCAQLGLCPGKPMWVPPAPLRGTVGMRVCYVYGVHVEARVSLGCHSLEAVHLIFSFSYCVCICMCVCVYYISIYYKIIYIYTHTHTHTHTVSTGTCACPLGWTGQPL